jgi:hypothetical protein
MEKRTQRLDSEARADTATALEVQRIDSIMKRITANPEWCFSMGPAIGKSPAEFQNGMVRFSESLRSMHIAARETADPLYSGISKFFKRCDTLEERALNIKEIERIIDKRRLDQRADAEDGLFFEPDLTDFDPTRYRVLKKRLGLWQSLLPTRAIPIGAQETKYKMYESTGETAPSSPGKMTGVNYVGVRKERFTNPIETSDLGYMLTTDDQRKAAYANEPLMDELQIAARQAVAQTLDRIAWNGDTTLGLNGAINHPGVSNLQAVLDGGTRSWSNLNKSNDSVFSDINAATAKIATDSRENWTPENTGFIMIIDRATKSALNRRMAAGTDTTLIQFIRNNTDAGISQIAVVPDILGSGPAGSNQALFYPFDPTVLRYRVNTDIIWAPMQWHDLTMKFPGEIIHGSVEVIYPVAMVELYDI